MKTIALRPGEPERDFGQLAAWFSYLEEEPTSEASLKEEFEQKRERIFQKVAEDEQGELLGFYWAVRHRSDLERADIYLFVRPEQRGQGIGRRLYEDLEQAAREAQVKKLRGNARDTCPEFRVFAERCGFIELWHQFAMELNLDTFEDRPYDEVIAKLQGEGFQFTSMEALGDTEEAQRKLFLLNDVGVVTTLGQDGGHAWDSFDDFQKSVCRSDWYRPGGQIVAIDTVTGAWAAMSAITRFEGQDSAYNLFTGVDMPYRGRKLGQAVKVLALRYARNVLGVHSVRTHHNTKNLPMIAIDLKLGYKQLPGDFVMEKILERA